MRVLALLVLLVLVSGCVKSKDAAGTDTNTTTPPPPSGGTPPAPVELSVSTSAPYAYSPATLTASAGDVVNLTYTNDDPVPIQQHNWVLDEAGATTEIIGVGESTSVTFTAPEAGTYTFYCSVGNHAQLGMTGTFTVE